MPKTMHPEDALDIEFYSDDLAEHLTIREYFKALLKTLFEEGEGFSGKRPFGNSGWEHDLVKPLVGAKAIPGTITATDENGDDVVFDPNDESQDVEAYVDEKFDYDAYIASLIEAM